ncbi:hypothetical protein D3C76_969380 [compost metagenome]
MGLIPLEGAETFDMVVIAQIDCLAIRTGADALDAQFLQSKQLTGLTDTVTIQIAPYTQVSPDSIAGIQLAVGIAISILHGLEAVLGLAAIGRQGILAEQFTATVDGAIAIAIQHQQAIVGLDPARAVFIAVAIVIEQYLAFSSVCFDTVAI